MGVMSRRIVPVCDNLCCFCPSLRARSRQPVKRYKKLIAEILPRNQEAEPNDRKIGKLCDYVSKNPLRVPKITETLEQRFYKELRHNNFGSVKVVVYIYRKFLSSCKEQMPLFASSLLGIIRTLLDQSGKDEMQILACSVLVDFIDCQTDGTHMFNLEGLIAKLCQLAQDFGEGERMLRLHSAGLQALASMVSFMGKYSHISMELDNIISVTLENYIDSPKTFRNSYEGEVPKEEDSESSFLDISKPMPSLTDPELDPSMDVSKNPSYWSRICLRNMARLAMEATTVRRVLDPLFHNFDSNNHWPLEKGVAYPVLIYLQSLLEEAGENSHMLLSALVKHLDNKNVSNQPLVQTDIVNITMKLGKNAKKEATFAITGAIFDLIKQLRKCLQISDELSKDGDCADNRIANLQPALEKCIFQLSNKVGDVGPVLDKLAVFLENIPTATIAARTTISVVHRTAKIVSSIPNISYHKKAFPDALFHQLLIAMTHPDHETRAGAHNILSAVLMPSLLSLRSDQNNKTSGAVSPVFGTMHKTKSPSFSFLNEGNDKHKDAEGESWVDDNPVLGMDGEQCRENELNSHSISVADGKTQTSLRLSSHQIKLLLASIWVQATSAENMPVNFEAIAGTYNIALLFIRYKTSNLMALIPSFQLALSLRSISLDEERGLQPSRRRSLFTMASYMLIFTAKAGNLTELIPLVKACLTENTADPYLRPTNDVRLEAINVEFDGGKLSYGSEVDDVAASRSLSLVELDDSHLRETVISQLIAKSSKITEDELSSMKQQLLQEFSLDDAYPLGAPLFMETPKPGSPLAQMELQVFEEIIPGGSFTDDETFTEANGSQSGRKTSLSGHSLDILSVNELLESVLETAREVASSQTSSTPVPYDQMMSQCEALVTGKQQKMSLLHGFKHQNDAKIFPSEVEKDSSASNEKEDFLQSLLEYKNDNKIQAPNQLALCSVEYGQQSSFRLPPSSPYDKFLKAAGC
ncbi:ARM repeat superfamily protein [Euphorbia peplus]|nr:ARM repeat superfamily protein [Euphorbia peplus]